MRERFARIASSRPEWTRHLFVSGVVFFGLSKGAAIMTVPFRYVIAALTTDTSKHPDDCWCRACRYDQYAQGEISHYELVHGFCAIDHADPLGDDRLAESHDFVRRYYVDPDEEVIAYVNSRTYLGMPDHEIDELLKEAFGRVQP